MPTRIVNLGLVRDLKAEWEKGRDVVCSGRVLGFNLTVMTADGQEQIILGGVYKADPQEAIKAILRMSAARAREEDEPPLFQASSF